MAVPAQPHDAFFRALVDEPARADRLVREYLPPDIAALLADAPVRAVEGTFVDTDSLATSRSDRLFEARLTDGRTALLYVVLEHKSWADPGTALQMMGYMHRIWQQYADGTATKLRALPPIVPLVFYHGRSPWAVARSVVDAVNAPEALAPFVRSLSYVLCDLGEMEDEALSGDPGLRSGLGALKYVFVPDLPEGVLARLMVDLPDDHPLEQAFFRYIVTTWPIDRSELEGAARIAKPQRWEALMSTIAQEWIKTGEARGEARGRSAGLAEGEAQGRAKALLQLLEVRFGTVSEGVRTRVLSASPRELDTWLGAVLGARDLDAVFGGKSTH